MRWWPRSIRWQMLLGLVLLEALSLVLFLMVLTHMQKSDVRDHIHFRLTHQATSLALQEEEAFEQQRMGDAEAAVRMTGAAPSTLSAKVTDPSGKVLFVSVGDPRQIHLDPAEHDALARFTGSEPLVFPLGGGRWEGLKPIYVGYDLRGYAWVESNPMWDDAQLGDTLRAVLIFGSIWTFASTLLVALMWRLISRPLGILHEGTRALMSMPESGGAFPLPVTVQNEFGDLIRAFNSMVASIQEQRSGLSDTLSLLDSMLANAPVGMAFFDRNHRFVRVNRSFADLVGMPISRMLGRTLVELLPDNSFQGLDESLTRVFSSEESVTELELHGESDAVQPWNWLVSAYPVRTSPEQVRWAGIIVRDVTERVRAEEALRKTEKLAATGRLAASIAHEINNPLEALTNLLFLLRNFSGLSPDALQYLEMADHEVRRVTEIAQQTLRFYRQSTLPQRATLSELLDSVLDLYKSRLHNLNIALDRAYDPELTLFCFSGEVRQVLANLVGNAIDAMPGPGRLIIRARRSQRWNGDPVPGIRFTVADTGFGMNRKTRDRIFEAFFTTKEDVGTGLGLWVSQEIIEKHHGEVRVRSRVAAPGRPSGTVFYIFLPDDETLTPVLRPTAASQSAFAKLSD